MHASGPREAITRLENILLMSAGNMPARAIRAQIAGSLDLLIQVTRMHDGSRRITSITEIVGMEGEVITMQDLFNFVADTDKSDGSAVTGRFVSSALRPHFTPKAELIGQGRELLKAMMSNEATTGQSRG
jgi:pilus assembly protein CpaF